jgi:hypothetical protein
MSAANKTDLTMGEDCFLAQVVCWFDQDTARDAASVSVAGMVDLFSMTLYFEAHGKKV